MGTLARESHIALYRQIARHLESDLANGLYGALRRLEFAHELIGRYGRCCSIHCCGI
jgi:hypothetical protein